MKKACLKKNFLSDNIVNNINCYISKQETKNIFILLIIFIAILPITINTLCSSNNIKNKKDKITFSKGIDVEKIKSSMELYGENVNGSFNRNECIIKTSSEKLILDISNNNKYIIKNIEKDNDDFYTIKVKKND